MVKPHVANITTIAPVHIEHFPEGLDGIAKDKAEIFDGMDAHGIAILNRDIPQFELLKNEAGQRGIKKIFSFGKSELADARLINCLIASNGTRVEAEILGEPVSFTLKDAGEHIALNALWVLLAVKWLGGDMIKSIEALRSIEPPSGRGKREYINIGDPNNPVTLIDESYNASPVAMEAAFKVVKTASWPCTDCASSICRPDSVCGRSSTRRSGRSYPLNINDLVFGLGPLINSAGRLGDAREAVRMLLATDRNSALDAAAQLVARNKQRQQVDIAATVSARQKARELASEAERKSIVLFDPYWNIVFIGITGSRISENFHKPTVILTESEGRALGSARWVPGFDLYEALLACGEMFDSFGGHAHAAGMQMPVERVADFAERFELLVQQSIAPESESPVVHG